MASVLDLLQQRLQVLVPRLEHVLSGTLARLALDAEDDLPLESIDASRHTLVDDHVADLLLGAILSDTDQVGQGADSNTAIELLDDPNVVLDQLLNEVAHVQHVVLSGLLERRVPRQGLRDFRLVQRIQLESEQLVDEGGELFGGLELTSVLLLHRLQEVNLFLIVRSDDQEDEEVVEAVLGVLAAGIELLTLLTFLGRHNSVVDGLVRLSTVHAHLLVHEVEDHELVELDLHLLEASSTHVSLRNLSRENLHADEVLASKSQLHLVQDELKLLLDLQRAIRLNLDLLDNLSGLIGLLVLFEVFAQLHGGLRVLTLQEHLALAGFSEGLEHLVLVRASRHLLEEFALAHGHHVDDGLLGLATSLDECQEELSHLSKLLVIHGQLQL